MINGCALENFRLGSIDMIFRITLVTIAQVHQFEHKTSRQQSLEKKKQKLSSFIYFYFPC